MPEEGKQIKRMADVLKSGGAMLSDLCPECGSPLFKVKNEVWCMNCNKRVVIIKEGEPTQDSTDFIVLIDIERIIITKLYENSQQLKSETDPIKLKELGNVFCIWLEALERLRKLQKSPV